ncbi:MAG: hypothetical protein JXQ30_03570 [Spirochaetes bacterium]|nr:hypothetical protein [Spirochaetota bacterium]
MDVEVVKVKAKLSPTFEFALPSGNIYQHFVHDFNDLRLSFTLNYNILDNDINGTVGFAYSLDRFTPAVTFTEELDFENYIAPALTNGTFSLMPTEKYIARRRDIELSLGYRITDYFSVVPAFLISDIFKGSLTTTSVLDDGVDLVPRIGFVYNDLKARSPEKGLYFNGIYFGSVFSMRFRQTFDNPVSLTHSNNLLFHFNIGEYWKLEQKVILEYPMVVWNERLVSFYALGGFDSIRGVIFGSIPSYRFLFFSTNFEKEIFPGAEVPFTPFKLQTRLHQFRLFLFVDELLTQQCLDAHSPLFSYTSMGGGFAFVLSGKEGGHFEIRLYAAQHLGVPFAPIIYLRTSLFDLERQL